MGIINNVKISNVDIPYKATNSNNIKVNVQSNFAEQLNNKLSSLQDNKNKNLKLNTSSIDEEFQKRKEEINHIRDDYAKNSEWDSSLCIPKLNPDIMEKILNLGIKDNDTYYSNGKLNIKKVATDCGLNLNNITPIELQSLKEELKAEGLIDNKIENDLREFISRSCADIFSKGNCSMYDAYNNISFSIYEKCKYFTQIDSRFGMFNSNINMISDFFK